MIRYLLLIGFIITSCAPKIENVDPPVDIPEDFSHSGTDVIPQKWWTVFGDEHLNKLVDSALSKNLNLAATWEQFNAAVAVRRRQKSFLWPDISAGSQNAISRPEPDFAGGENVQIGLSVAYEVDLWGRIRSAAQAADFRAAVNYYDYQAAAISLSASITEVYFQLITATKQLNLADRQMKTNEDLLSLIRARFTGGQVGAVDLLRQRQLVEDTRNQRLSYREDIQLLNNQLDILLGRVPRDSIDISADELPPLPELPVTGLPLELVRRRPDVVQAYNQVLAADRDMAEAIRNKYPRLSLNLSAQARNNNYANLFNEWAYTLAGNLVAPLLYGGRLRAEVDRTEALKNQELYFYGQTVLTAFREVEDALIQEKNQIQRLETLELQLQLAESTNRQLRIGFLYGTSNYLDVFLALDREQQLRRDFIDAQQNQIEIRIDMYRALAGSFEASGESMVPQEDNYQ